MNTFTFYVFLGLANAIFWSHYVYAIADSVEITMDFEQLLIRTAVIFSIVPHALNFLKYYRNPVARIIIKGLFWTTSLGLAVIIWILALIKLNCEWLPISTAYLLAYCFIYYCVRKLKE